MLVRRTFLFCFVVASQGYTCKIELNGHGVGNREVVRYNDHHKLSFFVPPCVWDECAKTDMFSVTLNRVSLSARALD